MTLTYQEIEHGCPTYLTLLLCLSYGLCCFPDFFDKTNIPVTSHHWSDQLLISFRWSQGVFNVWLMLHCMLAMVQQGFSTWKNCDWFYCQDLPRISFSPLTATLLKFHYTANIRIHLHYVSHESDSAWTRTRECIYGDQSQSSQPTSIKPYTSWSHGHSIKVTLMCKIGEVSLWVNRYPQVSGPIKCREINCAEAVLNHAMFPGFKRECPFLFQMSQWTIESSENKPPHLLSSLVCIPGSHWDAEHQFWGARPQPAIPAAPSQSLQALLRLPGQVLWIPLWRQCVRGLQGRTPVYLLRLKWHAVFFFCDAGIKGIFIQSSYQML